MDDPGQQPSTARFDRIRTLLADEASPLRAELTALLFDAVVAQPLEALIDRDALRAQIFDGLAKERGDRIAAQHVLPAIERIAAALAGRSETLRDLCAPAAEAQLARLVRHEGGPRYGWLRGSIDPDDVRELIAPVTQQLLMQFVAKLPIPGIGGGGGGGVTGGLGGLVGRLGKQVQKGAGQLADVGRSMLGGVVRDFSQTAASEYRVALEARIASAEGKQILGRMRDRMLSHVLAARVDDVVRDLMQLPRPEIAQVVTEIVANGRTQPLLRSLIESELDAQLATLAGIPIAQLLADGGLLETTRARLLAALDQPVRRLIEGDEFGAWLGRLLSRADETP